MVIKLSKIINIRIILLIVCIVIFVLLNSSQESYVQVSELTSTTLITTDIGTYNTTTDTQETPTGPTFPSSTPPGSTGNNGNGITNTNETSVPSQVIPIVIGSAIIILIAILLLQKRKSEKSSEFFYPKERTPSSSVKKTREKFRTQISTLMEILQEYLKNGKYAEGIVFGFHQLDSNMKRILGIKRETYLTPKEFSRSMDLPEIVRPLNEIIDVFYLARYRISPMKYEDLKLFIEQLQTLKTMSEFKSDIKIIRSDYYGEEK